MTSNNDHCPCRTGTAETTITIGTGGAISTTACAMLGIPLKVTTKNGPTIIVLCDSGEAREVGRDEGATADAVDSWYDALRAAQNTPEARSPQLLNDQN
jgi:hypothetical protein